jgi:hypothetical protein
MSTYLKRRMDLARQSADQREQARAAAVARAKEGLTPLEDRVRKLLEELPAEMLREGICLHSLQVRLRGRKHGTAHCGELGGVLRRLGFEKKRDWRARATGGHRALWRKVG